MSDVKGNGGPKLKFPSSCQCELLSDDCHGETRKKCNVLDFHAAQALT